tara:strand:- start:55 stop:546 length:492 start_codon:yes stop_codon:yes gene_type:complete
MAQEQIELEFRDELMQLQQMIPMLQNRQAMMQNPNLQNQVQMLQQKIESRKAVLIAEMMEEFSKEEKKITGDFGNDPIAKLKARELDLQAKDNARKEKEGEDKMSLDKMKAMMNQANVEEKLDQNEELAELRANTSIQKTILGKTLPNPDNVVPKIDIIRKDN